MKKTTGKMYLASDDKIASEMNYLLFTDGNGNWYSVQGSTIGDIVIDGSDHEDATSNYSIANALKEAMDNGDIVSIRDFVIDAMADGSELKEYKGKFIEDIEYEMNYHEDIESGDVLLNDNGCHEYYWFIANEELEWDEDGDLI